MSTSTPSSDPQTLNQLNQLWQVPPQVQGNTLSGGVVPAQVQPGAPGTAQQPAPAGNFQPQVPQAPPAPQVPQYQPTQFQYPQPQQPQFQQYQQPPAQTPATPTQAPQQPPAQNKSRALLDRYVQEGKIDSKSAAMFANDEQFLDDLYYVAFNNVNTQQEPPASQTPPTQQTPAPQVPQTPVAPAEPTADVDEMLKTIVSLQQAGAVTMENGRYVSKYPEIQSLVDKVNQEQFKVQQAMFELRNPGEFLKKHSSVFDPMVAPLRQEIEQLKAQLQQSMPKPHEAWIAQNEPQLRYVTPEGRQELTPAGRVYHQVYSALRASGETDLGRLHQAAVQAAEPLLQQAVTPPTPETQSQPRMSVMQAAAASQQPTNPGFNLPGSTLSRHQTQQAPIPVNNQGQVDFRALAQGVLNGSIPR